jgi:hypothetical protein
LESIVLVTQNDYVGNTEITNWWEPWKRDDWTLLGYNYDHMYVYNLVPEFPEELHFLLNGESLTESKINKQ